MTIEINIFGDPPTQSEIDGNLRESDKISRQQALTLAAEEGARAALRYPLTSTGGTTASTLDLRVAAAAQTARAMLPTSMSSLISSANVAQPVTCASPSGTQCVTRYLI